VTVKVSIDSCPACTVPSRATVKSSTVDVRESLLATTGVNEPATSIVLVRVSCAPVAVGTKSAKTR
jgi:hypothetical protein